MSKLESCRSHIDRADDAVIDAVNEASYWVYRANEDHGFVKSDSAREREIYETYVDGLEGVSWCTAVRLASAVLAARREAAESAIQEAREA